jgi:hypothetical protein
MAYTLTLTIHSYLRWLVLVASLVVIARSVSGWLGHKAFGSGVERAQVAFLAVVDTQLVLGLLLYGMLSPVTAAFFANPKAGMHDPQVRFFGVEHITMMVLALVVVHVARARSKRITDGTQRHKLVAISTIVWLVLTLAAIPWPGMKSGRPLFR